MSKKIDVSKGAYLKGDSHDAPSGGIKATVVDTGQEILVEGNEVVLNKKSMASNKKYTVTGTPKEIASAVNSIDGNGVKFDTGAKLKDHSTGETKIMAKGGIIHSTWFTGGLSFLNW